MLDESAAPFSKPGFAVVDFLSTTDERNDDGGKRRKLFARDAQEGLTTQDLRGVRPAPGLLMTAWVLST